MHQVSEHRVQVGRFTAEALADVWHVHEWNLAKPGDRMPVSSFRLRRGQGIWAWHPGARQWRIIDCLLRDLEAARAAKESA
jgi:hypothetical protein